METRNVKVTLEKAKEWYKKEETSRGSPSSLHRRRTQMP